MFAARAAFVLCLVSVGGSAPLGCEDLLRPLDQLDPVHLEGRRAMVAGSLSFPPYMERLRRGHSATSDFSRDARGNATYWRRSRLLGDRCHYASYNISLEGSSFTFDDGNVTTTFIRTSCHDCLLMSFDVESGKRQHFYLFSRRRELVAEELEEFRAQVECLGMSPPAVMDPTKKLCPQETAGDRRHRDRRSDGRLNH
ncbi:orm1 [Pungitius sinensis]